MESIEALTDRVLSAIDGIMTAILASLQMRTADDLFGGPQGSPQKDKVIAASIQWAERIMEKIDGRFR